MPPWPAGKAGLVGKSASPVRLHLIDAAPHMRLFVMGLVLRFSPKGVLPEQVRHS